MKTKSNLSQLNEWENFIKYNYRDFYNTIPSYYFNFGDKVIYGNFKNVIIMEELKNGKVYKIEYDSTSYNYKPILEPRTSAYKMWYELQPINEGVTSSFQCDNDLRLNYHQTDIDQLLNYYYRFGIEMSPDYQRGLVGELKDKQLLIDSIFHNIDIGKFVLIKNEYDYSKEHGGKSYEILDGKQRISTIIEFTENRFQYRGKYFKDLCPIDICFIRNYCISIAEVQNITIEQKYRYFLNLNKCGKSVTQDQLKKVEDLLKII